MKYLILNNQNGIFSNYKLGINDIENNLITDYHLNCLNVIIKIDKSLKETSHLLKSAKSFSFKIESDIKEGRNRNFIFPEDLIIDRVYIDYLNLDIANFMELKIIPEDVANSADDEVKKPEDISLIPENSELEKALNEKDITDLRQILKDAEVSFFAGATKEALIKKILENNLKIC